MSFGNGRLKVWFNSAAPTICSNKANFFRKLIAKLFRLEAAENWISFVLAVLPTVFAGLRSI